MTIKSTIAVIATAATLMGTGILPASQASADPFNPALTGKIQPLTPSPCATKPWLCGPGGIKLPPKPPAPTPKPGMSAGTAAALAVGGLLVGAAIVNANRPQAQPAGDAHIDWCFAHYKSYRLYDNSYQPYHGPRKPCISPYL